MLRACKRRLGLALNDVSQVQQGLPFLGLSWRFGKHRPTKARMVAVRKLRESDVVMHIFQRRETGQDDVRMAAGFVEVNVQAQHEGQRRKGLGDTRPLRRGEHRVGPYADQGLDLA